MCVCVCVCACVILGETGVAIKLMCAFILTGLNASSVLSSFGTFLKFYVASDDSGASASSTSTVTTTHPVGQINAFQVMMSAQVRLASQVHPNHVSVSNRKDELFNSIIDWLKKEGLSWKPSEVANGTASTMVSTIRDVLWYLDGHHSTLAERSCPIPHLFSQFVGYNTPEKSKHRKRCKMSLCSDLLSSHAQRLFGNLQAAFWSRPGWISIQTEVELLAKSLVKYADHLSSKRVRIGALHASSEPARTVANALTVQYVSARHLVSSELSEISTAVCAAGTNVPVDLESLLPRDRCRRYDRVQALKCGLSSPVVLATYSPGSNIGSYHWLWLTDATDISSALQSCQPVIESLKSSMPEYHTRAMRNAMYDKFGLVTGNVKKAVLRHFYRDLTGDMASSPSLSEQEVDERLEALFDLEEPELLYDLRAVNPGRPCQFKTFWEKAKEFLEEDVGTAVDERRHSQVIHVAKAISVRDFKQQVVQRCPPGTPVPSDELVRLQFVPAHKSYRTASKYTSRLQVKKKIQQRQWRKDHEDTHYAACIFRYMREYALLLRSSATLACLDDKHKVKVGEPNCPVAAAERGRQVLVHSSTSFFVGDHDFTRMSIIPSVCLLVDIPEELAGSWYTGQVHVLFKDGTFEPSSPARHSTELARILEERAVDHPVLFLYSDGGPDHRLTYASVKLALISLFRRLDLDYVCAARTAPFHSFRNPAERVMSILNLGLQSVGLARHQLADDQLEKLVENCNSLGQLRELARKNPAVKEAVLDVVSPAKITLTSITQRLELKSRKFIVDVSASVQEIDELWSQVKEIDSSFELSHSDKMPRRKVTAGLEAFLKHCCRERHYFFEIKKCGKDTCSICKHPRLPAETFAKLQHFPDPMPKGDGHYKPFEDVFGTDTTEEHRPSLQKLSAREKRLPFYPSVQHVRNCNMMLMCDECGMWRLVYAKRKLKTQERNRLQQALDDMSFSCGAALQDAEIPTELADVVYVKTMHCHEPIERLYYAADFESICVYCAAEVSPWSNKELYYPQCEDCADKAKIPNAKKN